MSQRLGYQTTFCISSAATLCALTLALRIKETPHRSHIPYRPALQRMFAKEALLPATLSCILTMSHSCVGAFLVMYGQSRGIHEVGLYFTVYAAGLLITRPLFGALADRYGAHRMIFAGLAFFALGFACISQARSFAALMASAAVNALGYGAITPLLQSLSLHATPASRRGAASNTSYAGTDLGYLLGPVAAGTFVDAVRPSISTDAQTYGTLYLFAIVPIAFGAVLLALRWQRLEALMAQNAPLHPPAP